MRSHHKIRNKLLMILLLLLVSITLTGCVSSKKKQKMFDMLRDGGYIEVGNRERDEYDEQISVDQSPVPVVHYYDIYRMEDVTYTIRYASVSDDKEDVDTYAAYVEIERPGEETEYETYLFENRKVLGPLRKLYFVGKKERASGQ